MTHRGDRGVAIVMVLWGLALLAGVLVVFTGRTRGETVATRNALEVARARHLGDGAIELATGLLLRAGPEARLRVDGAPFAVVVDGIEVVVRIQDEAGKLDLNGAPGEVLYTFFLTAGAGTFESDGLARAVLDWRDEGEVPGARRAYAAAGRPLGPKNRPFENVAELSLLLGMTPVVYEKLRPYVTVATGSSGIDPAVAPQGVIASMPGFSEAAAAALIRGRPPAFHRQPPQTFEIPALDPYFAPSSGFAFTITAEVGRGAGPPFVREALVVLGGAAAAPYSITALR